MKVHWIILELVRSTMKAVWQYLATNDWKLVVVMIWKPYKFYIVSRGCV